MSDLIALTFEKRRTTIDAVVVDATISESHTRSAEITNHPVEKGADISDHYRLKPDVLQIEGVVSNSPVPGANDPAEQHTSGRMTFTSKGKFTAERASTAYQDLLKLSDNGTKFDVVTAIRSYENMMLENLVVPRDAKIGQSLKFSATLKQVTSVTNKEVTIDPVGQGNKNLGKKATTTAPAAEKNASTLKQLADTATGDKLLRGLGLR